MDVDLVQSPAPFDPRDFVQLGVVIPEFHKRGGTERCIASLTEALARRGHQVTIFSHARDARLLPAARWHRVPMFRRPHIARFTSFFINNALWRLGWGVFRGERFDAVLSTGPDVLRPTVTAFHCCATSIANDLQTANHADSMSSLDRFKRWANLVTYRLVALLEGYVVRRGATRVVAVSDVLKSDLLAAYRAPEVRVRVVHDGVHIADFRPATCQDRQKSRSELQLSPDGSVVLFVGHNWERKGLRVLVDALTRIHADKPELRPFLLVAGGMRVPEFESQVQTKLHGQAKFLGRRDDLERIYGAADLCVLPSSLESFGLPVLEAMACGLPVVVSRAAGVAELITDGLEGLLLDNPADPEELAGKLDRLLSHPELRQVMGNSGRRTAEKYSWDRTAEQFETLLRDASGRGG